MEPLRDVHVPWQEITKDSKIQWQPGRNYCYTSAGEGTNAGPSTATIHIVERATSLTCIFFDIVPLTFFSAIAQLTEGYCYKDWVVEKTGNDCDSNSEKKTFFVDCPSLTEGIPTPGRRHYADNESKKFKTSSGFIIAWIGILIIGGAHFSTTKR